ncbi:MAG TPA: leucine-rich repeat domain-containing protein [Bacilli bacterium]|nr:leucine-rich repeat domain-containing protein [Bacilli bacterium]
MNKNTKTAGVAITTLGLLFSLYVAFSMGNVSFTSFNNNDSNDKYVLNLGNEKNRSNIAKAVSKAANPNNNGDDDQEDYFDAVTENGNVIKFGYRNIDFSPNYNPNANIKSWGVFNADSALYNVTPINGMTSIEVDFSNNESLSLSYGWFNDETGEIDYEVEGVTLNSQQSTFSFFQDGPEILKIYNSANNQVPLADVVITYSCYDTINPYCIPTIGDFTYEYSSSDDIFAIQSYEGNETEIVIPTKIFDGTNSAYVTEIADEAFKNYYVQTLYMPNTITKIGDEAFYNCTSLESITLSRSLTEIGDEAFHACNQLTNMDIPSSVTRIGEGAFSSCFSLTSISLPTNLEKIEESTFENCHKLTSISLPDGVTSIEENAFKNCFIMTSVDLSESLTKIGDSAFENCQNLLNIDMPDTITSIGDNAFRYCYNLASVNLSSSLLTIGDNAFNSCGALTKIDIPDNVISIGQNAFNNCWNLTSIILPVSLQSIFANSCSGAAWNVKIFYEGSSLPTSLNNSLKKMLSKVYFYSETTNTDGRHWRYVAGEPVIW